MAKKSELKVFISSRDSTCDECKTHLGRKAWITLQEDKGALCLDCADLNHLVFLPSGDTALTRRSRKYSKLFAIVLKWSRARKRYERQGLLVEEEALERAEAECDADEEERAHRRELAAARRAEQDEDYIKMFAGRIRELFPSCPSGREETIARHACRRHSGRVGRSAAAKEFDERMVRLAVAAHVRHAETDYDEFLLDGMDRHEARRSIQGDVDDVLDRWSAE